jgi:AcrR family transcriptional regulator
MAVIDHTKELAPDVLIKAAEIIREKGFDGTSVSEISAAVGLTKGGLYHYITGKRDLLYRIMKFGLENLEARVSPALEISDPGQRLREVIRIHIEGITRERGLLTAVTEEVQALEEPDRKVILAAKRRYFDLMRGILEELRDRGRIRSDVDLSVATFNVLGMVLHFARWYREGGRFNPAEIADQIADLAIAGLSEPVAGNGR